MSEADGRPARPDDERSADFAELMRMEREQNAAPISGLAATGLVAGVLSAVAGLYISVLVGLFWGLCALVFAVASVAQIRHGERRGIILAVLGVAIVLAWAVYGWTVRP